MALAAEGFRLPEGGIGLFWGDVRCHEAVNERPRPGAHIPDIFRDELEEDGCKDLVIEAKYQALALEDPVDAGDFFVLPDRVRRADIACYLRDLRVVEVHPRISLKAAIEPVSALAMIGLPL